MTPLESALQAGDAAATLDLLRAMPAAEREKQRDAVMALAKQAPAQRQALDTAVILCGTSKDLVEAGVTDWSLLIALGREFEPRSLTAGNLFEAMRSGGNWAAIAPVIYTGLYRPIDPETYPLRLIGLPMTLRRRESLDRLFVADPGLRPSLLRVLEIEGTAETSLASSDKYNHDPKLAWGPLLLSLVDDGIATRAQLLDLTLGALEKDWPQYRSSWFSRFHAALAPTPAETRPHLARYLALCASRIPPTVAMALEALKTLDEAAAIAGDTLVGALVPVMTATVKTQVDAAMKLLDRVVKREPGLAARAAEIIVPALLHEASTIQAGVLKRLETWGLTPQAREQLQAFTSTVAASHQPRLQKLLGEPAALAIVALAAASAVAPVRQVQSLDDDRRLPPIADVQELVECIAHVFEHADDVDAFERAILGLALSAPLSGEERKRFAPVAKRALKVRKPLARELARLLCFAVDGTRLPRHVDVELGDGPASALVGARIEALMALIAQGRKLVPLASPTHRGGFLAADALAERIAAHAAAGVQADEIEQVQALLRLAPGTASADVARKLPDSPLTRALRYALGDAVEPGPQASLFAAAARIRHPRADDAVLDRRHPGLGPDGALAATYTWHTTAKTWEVDGKSYTHHDLHVPSQPAPRDTPQTLIAVLRHVPTGRAEDSWRGWSFCGREAGLIRYGASMLPSDLEAWCAQGAWAFGNNLDWWEAEWHNRAYLDVLLDPVVPMTPMARLLLVLALCGKEPGQTATAVDLLLQSHAQGRLPVDAELLSLVRALFATPLPKPARLHKSLQAALRADPDVHGLAFALLGAVVQGRPADPPRDIGVVLELMLELKLRHGLALPDDVRATLLDMKLSGNSSKLRASLLA
ncbi:MAG TPA: DUF6493 family protein [Roseateles sp.]